MAESLSQHGMFSHTSSRGDHWVLVGIFPDGHFLRCSLSLLFLSLSVYMGCAISSFILIFKTSKVWQQSLNGIWDSSSVSHHAESWKTGRNSLSHILTQQHTVTGLWSSAHLSEAYTGRGALILLWILQTYVGF